MSESSYHDHVPIITVSSILIITTIVGNSMVCTVIMRNRDMRIPVNYLLVNLAVADTTFVTFFIPKLIASHGLNHPEGLAGKILCALLTGGSLAWVGAYSSVFSLVAIAFERYYAVIYPYESKGKLTNGKLKVIITCSWILSLILATPRFVTGVNNNSCIYLMPEWINKAVGLTTLALPIISFMLMVGLYSRVVYTLWFKRDDDNGLTYQQKGMLKVLKRATLMVVTVTVTFGISVGSESAMHILKIFGFINFSPAAIPIAHTGVLKVRKRVTLMVVAVSAIFGICWGTDSVIHIMDDSASFRLNSFAIHAAHAMIMFNAAVNPFAYALINQRFREKMKEMICCRLARVYTERETRALDIQLANNTTQPASAAPPTSTF